MGKRELVVLLNLSSWCLVVVGWLFLALPWGCLRLVIVVFPDHTHYFYCYRKIIMLLQEYPWMLSSSDDQTIRIWNWQARNCII